MSTGSNHDSSSSGASHPEADASFSGIPVEEISAALRELLRSSAFALSKRCGDFIAFVVEQTLLGQQHELKERTIGVAVFGRTPAYDTNVDAVVRIKASEVRKRLGFYYAGVGKDATVRIGLPTGGYVPKFTQVKASKSEEEEDRPLAVVLTKVEPVLPPIQWDEAPAPAIVDHRSRWHAGIELSIAAVVLLVITLLCLRYAKPISVVAQFWDPVVQNPAPVLLVTTPVPTYIPYTSSRQIKATQSSLEYVLTTDQFVGEGDVQSAELISTALQNLGHPSEMKVSNSIDFHELSHHSLVLIGYSSTQWASISQRFRYYIDDDKGGMVTNRGQPTEWYPHHLAKDLHTDEDFAIVSRVYVPEVGAMVVLVTGATQYGTKGAAELVTNPEMLSAALRGAPKDWPKKNLQLVLHLKVIGDTPETPEVVASEFW